ncbi:hypothetical protein [Motilibacter aurantiacus]|uniref:hypothetical protein n=1 Tax=Motilibacter aurantiacus TaxID=2714955 RepID=UPI00140C707D|nr:hypothetical protein [Motilibacter aurantiacus]NHC47463.1 hypothetical protein [Motilibacter aurantiacus]
MSSARRSSLLPLVYAPVAAVAAVEALWMPAAVLAAGGAAQLAARRHAARAQPGT